MELTGFVKLLRLSRAVAPFFCVQMLLPQGPGGALPVPHKPAMATELNAAVEPAPLKTMLTAPKALEARPKAASINAKMIGLILLAIVLLSFVSNEQPPTPGRSGQVLVLNLEHSPWAAQLHTSPRKGEGHCSESRTTLGHAFAASLRILTANCDSFMTGRFA